MKSLTSVTVVVLLACVVHVSLQEEVVVQEGQNALLPCFYKRPDLPPEPTVTWTDPEDKLLLKLEKSKVERMNSNVLLSEKHPSGNFSITLLKVSKQQKGIYDCLIHHVDYPLKIFLNVTERIQKTEVREPEGGAAELHPSCFILIQTLCFLLSMLFS